MKLVVSSQVLALLTACACGAVQTPGPDQEVLIRLEQMRIMMGLDDDQSRELEVLLDEHYRAEEQILVVGCADPEGIVSRLEDLDGCLVEGARTILDDYQTPKLEHFLNSSRAVRCDCGETEHH